jgi:hypothetical protein
MAAHRASPAFQAANAWSMRPKRRSRSASMRAPVCTLVRGSSSRWRPAGGARRRWRSDRPTAVICISPTAPRGDTARRRSRFDGDHRLAAVRRPRRAGGAASRSQGCTALTSGAISSHSSSSAASVLPGTGSASGRVAQHQPVARVDGCDAKVRHARGRRHSPTVRRARLRRRPAARHRATSSRALMPPASSPSAAGPGIRGRAGSSPPGCRSRRHRRVDRRTLSRSRPSSTKPSPVQRQRPFVERLHVEPEAVRAQVAEGHALERARRRGPGPGPGPGAAARCA